MLTSNNVFSNESVFLRHDRIQIKFKDAVNDNPTLLYTKDFKSNCWKQVINKVLVYIIAVWLGK